MVFFSVLKFCNIPKSVVEIVGSEYNKNYYLEYIQPIYYRLHQNYERLLDFFTFVFSCNMVCQNIDNYF